MYEEAPGFRLAPHDVASIICPALAEDAGYRAEATVAAMAEKEKELVGRLFPRVHFSAQPEPFLSLNSTYKHVDSTYLSL